MTSLPFGDGQATSGSCGDPSPLHFTGKQRDTETGNDDFGARYYASSMGRWMSPDWSEVPVPVPYAHLTNPQTLNLYAMVADNPVTFADLDGHGCPGAGSTTTGGESCSNPDTNPESTQGATGRQKEGEGEQAGNPQQASAPAVPLIGVGASAGAGTVAVALGTAAAATAVVGAAAALITSVTDTLVENARGKEQLAAVESTVAVANAAILMSQNKQNQKIIKGLLDSAQGNLTKMTGPDDNHHKKEIRAALERAKEKAGRLIGKAKEEALQKINSLAGRVPGGLW